MRKRTGKKVFSAIAACLLAVTGNFPAMAAEIKKVRLRLTAEDFDESGRPEAEFQTDSEAYEVSGIEKNEEDIYEVELTALEGNEFAVMTQSDIRLTGIRASCSRAVRKNGRGTLSLSVKAEGLCDVTGEIGNARFRETMAEWDKADNAYAYMVLLYRNSKRIGHPHKTQGTTYDFSPLMRERGIQERYRAKRYRHDSLVYFKCDCIQSVISFNLLIRCSGLPERLSSWFSPLKYTSLDSTPRSTKAVYICKPSAIGQR